MSISLSLHRIIDTFVTSDIEERNILVENMAYNLRHGAWTTAGCRCNKCREVIQNKKNEFDAFWLGIMNEAKTKLKS